MKQVQLCNMLFCNLQIAPLCCLGINAAQKHSPVLYSLPLTLTFTVLHSIANISTAKYSSQVHINWVFFQYIPNSVF